MIQKVGLTDIAFTVSCIFLFLAHFLLNWPFPYPHPLHRYPVHVSSETNGARHHIISIWCSCYDRAYEYVEEGSKRCPQLASFNLIKREETNAIPLIQTAWSILFCWTPSHGQLWHHWDSNSQTPEDRVGLGSHIQSCCFLGGGLPKFFFFFFAYHIAKELHDMH